MKATLMGFLCLSFLAGMAAEYRSSEPRNFVYGLFVARRRIQLVSEFRCLINASNPKK